MEGLTILFDSLVGTGGPGALARSGNTSYHCILGFEPDAASQLAQLFAKRLLRFAGMVCSEELAVGKYGSKKTLRK